MATVEEYCRHIVLLSRGKTLLSGDLHEIKAGYGHTHLSVSSKKEILPLAKRLGMTLLEETAATYEFGISGEEQARQLLKDMIAAGLFPEKYEIRTPSLHEIFVDCVTKSGDAAD